MDNIAGGEGREEVQGEVDGLLADIALELSEVFRPILSDLLSWNGMADGRCW